MSGAVPAAIAVVTFGRRSPVEVPPELACTTICGCEALKELTSGCITLSVGGVCACQNWIVTFPVELVPELGPDDPEHPASARVNAAIPASAIRFISASFVSSALAAADHPLTAPVIACTNRRWPTRNTSNTGAVVKTVPAIMADQSVTCSPWNVVRPTCTVKVRLDVIAISGQKRSFHAYMNVMIPRAARAGL